MVSLREIVFNHPQWMAIACVAWIAVAIWIVSLIGWMIQGEVDGIFGMIGIAIALALGYFSFMPPTEALRPFTALAVVGTVVIFPPLRHALNQRALVTLDVEAMERAYEQLQRKPDNYLMLFKIGKLLYEGGHIGPGLAVAAEALKGMPEKVFNEEHRMYARWRRLNSHVNINHPTACIDCGHSNPPTSIHCERCGHPYLIDVIRGRWVGRDFAKKLIGGWIAGVFALAGIPLASMLPPIPAIGAIITIMIGAIIIVWLAFRSTGEKKHA
jgi:hypothetical protein